MSILFWFYLLLPFGWALNPFPGADLALARLFPPAIFLFWLARSLLSGRVIFKQPLFQSFFLAWACWSLLSLSWALDPVWGVRKALFLFNFFCLIPLLVLLAGPLRKRIADGVVYGAFLAALISLLQFSSQFIFGVAQTYQLWTGGVLPFFLGGEFGAAVAAYPSLLVNIAGSTYLRASAFFPDPHICSLYLGIAFPLALAWAWMRGSGKSFLLPAVILAADLLTFSRAGYFALSGSMVIGMSMLFLSQTNLKKTLSIGFFLAVLVGSSSLTSVGSRFLSSFSPEDGSQQERIRLLMEAVENVKYAPLLGVGLGNYPLFVKPEAVPREPIYAHNLYLDVFLETGLIGLSLFLLPVFFALWRGFCLWHNDKEDMFLAALIVALFSYLLHSLFESPLFSVHILPLSLLLMALLATYEGRNSSKSV